MAIDMTPAEFNDAFEDAARHMSNEELQRFIALPDEKLGHEAWRAIVRRATFEFLEEKVAAGELVRLPNGNYMKRAEWDARQNQATA